MKHHEDRLIEYYADQPEVKKSPLAIGIALLIFWLFIGYLIFGGSIANIPAELAQAMKG